VWSLSYCPFSQSFTFFGCADEISWTPKKETIAYCRIGERSAHTWFALKYLVGLHNVRSYDGSWTEYGSIVGAPIEKAI